QTNYPWDGRVTIHVDPARPVRMDLRVRVPEWTGNPTASDLYRFADENTRGAILTVNGQPLHGGGVCSRVRESDVARERRKVDVVVLDMPMPVRRVLANDKVTEDAGKSAIQRGPILYTLEGVDNGGSLKDVKVPLDAKLTATFKPDLLGGVQVITGTVG